MICNIKPVSRLYGVTLLTADCVPVEFGFRYSRLNMFWSNSWDGIIYDYHDLLRKGK